VTRFDDAFAPIAVATRSGFDESLHHGAGVALGADGSLTSAVGDPDVVVYPRSCLKPLQVHAMLGLGLSLPDELVAVACASHDGGAIHLDAVRAILDTFGLAESDLQNTPSHSLCDPHESAAPSSLRQNCSGKHAAMLATCVVNAWPIDTYLDVDHPLQAAITAGIAELGCTVHHLGVDGCGAPTHAIGLDELAGAFAKLSGGSVGSAMRAHPVLVGGAERDVSLWMQAVPGLMAKEGAAGVMAGSLDGGRAFAFKIASGSDPARQAVTPQALRTSGVDVDRDAADTLQRVAVPMLGHGREVGRIEPLEWTPCGS
jgi:L-asparaginase II